MFAEIPRIILFAAGAFVLVLALLVVACVVLGAKSDINNN